PVCFGITRPLTARPAIDEFRPQVLPFVKSPRLEDSKYMRMIQSRRHPRLLLETTTRGFIGNIRRNQFDGDKPSKACIPCAKNFTHSAASDERQLRIRAEWCCWIQSGSILLLNDRHDATGKPHSRRVRKRRPVAF